MAEKMKAVVVGAGYWGPNLARNFRASADWDLAGICDLDEDRAQAVAAQQQAQQPATPVALPQ